MTPDSALALGALAAAVVFWAAFLLLAHIVLGFVIAYELRDDCFAVTLFRVIVLSRVRYSDVISAEVVTMPQLVSRSLRTGLFWATRAGNRVVTRRAVVITRRPGAGRPLIVTPPEPDKFVERVRAHSRVGRSTQSDA